MTTEELTALGLSEEQVKGVMALHGKDINTTKSSLETAEKERDNYKGQAESLQTQLDTANDTISKFGDATPESIESLKADVEKYKNDAQAAQDKYNQDITARDQKTWLDSQLDTFGVASPLARKAIIAEVSASTDKGGLPWRNGAFLGFNDYMSQQKEKDPTLYQTQEEKDAANAAKDKEDNPPGFAGSTGDDGKGGAAQWTPPKLF